MTWWTLKVFKTTENCGRSQNLDHGPTPLCLSAPSVVNHEPEAALRFPWIATNRKAALRLLWPASNGSPEGSHLNCRPNHPGTLVLRDQFIGSAGLDNPLEDRHV